MGPSRPNLPFIHKKLIQAKNFWRTRWFDPHESFLKLKSFWVPFVVIIVGFIFLCWKVSDTYLLEFSWNWDLQNMYEWFKIPLWELALLIPVLGLFNANHKSEQSKASMELTRSQNNFANYYKHLEEFEKYMGKAWVKKSEFRCTNERLLHSVIFGGDEGWNSTPDIEILEVAVKQNLEILLLFEEFMRLEDSSVFYYELLLKVDLSITNLKIKLADSLEIDGVFLPVKMSRIDKNYGNKIVVDINLLDGDVGRTIHILVEMYKFIEVSFGFSPRLSGILGGCLQILKEITKIVPPIERLNPIGLMNDKNSLYTFVNYNKIRVFLVRESLKQKLMLLQE